VQKTKAQKKTAQKPIERNWVLLRSGKNNTYYYDKNSVIEIKKGIKKFMIPAIMGIH